MSLLRLLVVGLLATFTQALAQGDCVGDKKNIHEATKIDSSTTLLATSTGNSQGLNEAAQAAGKLWFGAAISIPRQDEDNEHFLSVFRSSKEFGQATPANSMKFAATERHPGKFDFTRADKFLEVAKDKKIRWYVNSLYQLPLPLANTIKVTLSFGIETCHIGSQSRRYPGRMRL